MVNVPTAVNGTADDRVDLGGDLCPGWHTERTGGRLVAKRLGRLTDYQLGYGCSDEVTANGRRTRARLPGAGRLRPAGRHGRVDQRGRSRGAAMSVTLDASCPWSNARTDPDEVIAEAGRLRPGVIVWRGEWTGSYWALLGDRLHEFKDSRALLAEISKTVASPRAPTHSSTSPMAAPGRRNTWPSAAMPPPFARHSQNGQHAPTASGRHRHARECSRWRRFWDGLRRFFLGQ
jgi:hypothetical protein